MSRRYSTEQINDYREVFELVGQIKELTDRAKDALDRTREDS